MTAALTRVLGMHHLALAQDAVQDAFCRALEVWKFRGVPESPSAWLMATARNCAMDILRRDRTARTFAPELGRLLDSEWTMACTVQEQFAPNAIKDDELRMMFSCCDPRLAEEAQVAVMLHVLCGFSTAEIAAAFLISEAATEKRMVRAKKVLATSKRLFDVQSPADVAARLPSVQRALYLLFNEGYHGASAESTLRDEFCREAMRLVVILLDHAQGATPSSAALAALMCLAASRTPARLDADGHLNAFADQDRSQWDQGLLAEGLRLLELSSTGPELTEYHVEAAIACVHAAARRAAETDWQAIVSLYDTLLRLRPSPVVALNRAIAIGRLRGPPRGLAAIADIAGNDRLEAYPFYFAALGDLEFRQGSFAAAKDRFRTALNLARNPLERRFFERRMEECGRRATGETSGAGDG